MARNRIHIENLQIRFPRGSGAEVRNIGIRIGREIMGSLASDAKGRSGAIRIDKLSAGKFDASTGIQKIPTQVAASVSAEIKKKFGTGGR